MNVLGIAASVALVSPIRLVYHENKIEISIHSPVGEALSTIALSTRIAPVWFPCSTVHRLPGG